MMVIFPFFLLVAVEGMSLSYPLQQITLPDQVNSPTGVEDRVLSDNGAKRFCGANLAATFQKLCAQPRQMASSPDPGHPKSLIQTCCIRPCTFTTMLAFCPPEELIHQLFYNVEN